MAMNWDKFDKEFDVDTLAKEVEEAEANGSSGFENVPHGNYDVAINKLELKESNAGDPMVSCWFKVLAGEHKGSLIFMNQVVTRKFQIHIVNDFLRSLDSGVEIKFVSYGQYAQLMMDVHEAVDGKLEFGLKYGKGKKDFSTYEITDVYDAEGEA